MRRQLTLLLTRLFGFALLAAASFVAISPASAATIAPTTTCSNGVDNTPGLGLICETTIVNTITPSGKSASVTIRECHGAAGDPEASCSIQTNVLGEPVTAVTQCNGAINDGGGTLRCSVQVTNRFIGLSPGSTSATVNQCVGSGGGITFGCDPFPATTSGATITQCNDSANGGTLVALTCTAAGTASATSSVTINQCNNSANGGGALVICSSSITNVVVAAGGSASPSDSASPSGTASAAPSAGPATPATSPGSSPGSVSAMPVAASSPSLPDTSVAK
jgi:hypothetical protein